MGDAIALIDRIIEEHKTISQKLQTLEEVANDAGTIIGLGEAKEAFVPGRFEEKKGLETFQKLLGTIDQGIRAHFSREEEMLSTALEKHADNKLASALNPLLLEHEDLRDRLAHAKQDVAELIGGSLSRSVWKAKGYDMRAYVSHTRKLFEAHAGMEQELLHKLRSGLMRAQEGND